METDKATPAPRPRRIIFGPLWRFIDGAPGDSRARIARRARVLVTIATGLANLGGALVAEWYVIRQLAREWSWEARATWWWSA